MDDEEGILDEMADFFEDDGYWVICAGSGEAALKMLRANKPRVVLLDLKLPDMSGLEVLKVAKEMHTNTKVIVNTGYVDPEGIDRAEKLGCDAFLQKPFDLFQVKEEVERLL